MRWLFRFLVFGLDFLTFFPVALWRGLRGHVEPDRVQQAAESHETVVAEDLDAETERLLAQVQAAERRVRVPRVSQADIDTRPSCAPRQRVARNAANDDHEAALDWQAQRGLSLLM